MSYTPTPHSAPAGGGVGVRASMPPPARSPPSTGSFSKVQQAPPLPRPTTIPEGEDPDTEVVAKPKDDSDSDDTYKIQTDKPSGDNEKGFKFPPEAPSGLSSPTSSSPSSSKRDGAAPAVPVLKITIGHENKGTDGTSSGGRRGRRGSNRRRILKCRLRHPLRRNEHLELLSVTRTMMIQEMIPMDIPF